MRKALFVPLVFSVLSAAASANPAHWTLSGVTFADGGTASGSFVYDADTNTYSAVNITTTPGSVILTGATLQYVSNGFAPSNSGVLTAASSAANLTGTRAFALFFSPALSNAGGSVSLAGQEATCADAACSNPAPPSRLVTAGSLSGLGNYTVPALSPGAMAVTALLLAAAALVALRKGV